MGGRGTLSSCACVEEQGVRVYEGLLSKASSILCTHTHTHTHTHSLSLRVCRTLCIWTQNQFLILSWSPIQWRRLLPAIISESYMYIVFYAHTHTHTHTHTVLCYHSIRWVMLTLKKNWQSRHPLLFFYRPSGWLHLTRYCSSCGFTNTIHSPGSEFT